ncbi:hypothetical protein D9C73_019092 [Collichthys lucidus]|uniref:Uncharacterized protein n=1 Tax=Collichthys lucidus TaxID=240159 RepID=A0A4U5V9I0_COLLU|nr:hypothetical protein D9C73_019092 [Collichthys lucidus]
MDGAPLAQSGGTVGTKAVISVYVSVQRLTGELGLDRALHASDALIPDDMSEEEVDPLNRAVLPAVVALNEVTQIEEDMCVTVDARIQTLYLVLRDGYN